MRPAPLHLFWPALLRRRLLYPAGALAGLALVVCGALPALPQAAEPKLPPDAEKIGEDLYRVGKAKVDLKARTVTCTGTLNMRRGTIEYLAVAPGGKLHESVLSVDVRPLHLQISLILLGLEPKGGLRYQGDTQAPQGAAVELWASWQRDGRTVKVRAEELVWDVVKKRPMAAPARGKTWVFSGSRVDADGFVADRELSLVGTYRDPAAILNNALETGSDDAAYKVNERIAPPVGTPITLTVSAPVAGVPLDRPSP